MARKRMYFSSEKAIRELGLPQTPAETALADAVTWFTERGYTRSKRA
jgi:dihydroflavonol-4-reductase